MAVVCRLRGNMRPLKHINRIDEKELIRFVLFAFETPVINIFIFFKGERERKKETTFYRFDKALEITHLCVLPMTPTAC